ncbi:thioredoxin family protein [Bacteroidales bacterium]
MNQSLMDPVKQRPVLIDSVDRNGLLTGEMGEFFLDDYHNYKPDSSIVDEIETRISGIVIHVVFGSWCGDSKEQVPRFLKLLDQLNTFPEIYFTAVDSGKKGLQTDVTSLNIERVPTFIIYRNQSEIGRIVETPIESLEKDLLGILQKP